jgi:hypothetical protein
VVFSFLDEHEFSQFKPQFEREQLDDSAFELLKQEERLTDDMLKSLGFQTVGTQLKFLDALQRQHQE